MPTGLHRGPESNRVHLIVACVLLAALTGGMRAQPTIVPKSFPAKLQRRSSKPIARSVMMSSKKKAGSI